jgi:hypothetical protein
MRRYGVAALVSLLLLIHSAGVARACSGLLDCAFGWSERTELRTNAETEQARITAQRDQEVARIEGEAAARVRQAEAEVERVRQMQYQTEADRDVAIAQAQRQADEYRAMIAGLTSERVAGIQSNADTQIAALQGQAQIAIAGITETGSTERWRIAGSWSFVIVLAVLIAVVILGYVRRQQQQQIVLLPHERTQLPWYNDSIEVREVKGEYIVKR